MYACLLRKKTVNTDTPESNTKHSMKKDKKCQDFITLALQLHLLAFLIFFH